MSILIKTLIRMGLLKDDLDYHFIRASMVIIYFFFGYQPGRETLISRSVMLASQPGEAQSELSWPSLASCSLLLTMSLIKLCLIMTWGQTISMSAIGIDRSDII
jgi:hypothetical protein